VTILNAESAARVGPFNILKFVADDSARSAFHASFIGKEHAAVILGRIAGGGTAIDALLANAFEAGVGIDDPDVRTCAINVIRVKRQLAFDGGRIENARSLWI
jgi:hypothetical protein